jgi:hypothetical protein
MTGGTVSGFERASEGETRSYLVEQVEWLICGFVIFSSFVFFVVGACEDGGRYLTWVRGLA